MAGNDPEQLSDFLVRLESAGLGRYARQVEQLGRPSIRLRSQPGSRLLDRLGGSRLGGVPDLPADFRWPDSEGVPLSFIAQVDLSETRRFDLDRVLPERGLLSFFYDSEQGVWGFDPADWGSWAVVYSASDAQLVRHEFPATLPSDGRFRPTLLVPEPEQTWPPWESTDLDTLGLDRDEQFVYADLFESFEGVIHRLLGHPDPVQGDMQLECQLASHGLYCGDSSGYQDPRAADLRPGAVSWRLLLQIDSDEEAGMMWGDLGRLYYWIPDEALRDGRWDETWLILQCG